MYFFIAVLTLGFVYELQLGAIDLKMISLRSLDDKLAYIYLFISQFLKIFIYGFLLKERGIILYVNNCKLLHLLTIMKFNEIISLNCLVDIAVVDLITTKSNGRFVLNYVFWNLNKEIRIFIKIFTNGLLPIYSLNSLYKSSIWLEREVWDMYGIKFLFHGSLRRILTDYGFKGHPLRKDFPLIGYIDIYYDDSLQGITLTTIEITQTLRYYEFENPWNKWSQ